MTSPADRDVEKCSALVFFSSQSNRIHFDYKIRFLPTDLLNTNFPQAQGDAEAAIMVSKALQESGQALIELRKIEVCDWPLL